MQQGPPYPYHHAPPPRPSGSSSAIITIVIVCVLIVPLVGVIASLAIYGVRRYLAAAKTSEARNTVSAIARAAVASYEREIMEPDKPAHALCDSTGPNAPGHGPVPMVVPSAVKYMPSSSPGTDFETGTREGGWRCLRFSMTQPIYYQYHYNKGSGYLDILSSSLGPDAFEAAAKGDIDGDGNPSLFTRSGKVNPSTKSIALSAQIHIVDEFE